MDNDLVLDVSGAGRLMGAGPSIPLVLNYENHKITDRFKAMTFFPLHAIRSAGKDDPERNNGRNAVQEQSPTAGAKPT